MAAAPRACEDGLWLRCYVRRPRASGQIVCFGPAGATASFFRGWAEHAPADVEVWALAYPGRERRAAEPPIHHMDELADRIVAELKPRLTRPTLLLGHSMGASVAFEVTRRMEAAGVPPTALVISGRPGPRRQRDAPRDLHTFGDTEIVAYLRTLGGTPTELLDDPEIRGLILPAFRADFALIGRYRPALHPPVATPATIIWGDRDPDVGPDDVGDWSAVLRRLRGARSYPGAHFFLSDLAAKVVDHASTLLAVEAATRAPARPRGDRRSPAAGV
jgi:pyochelin biosynthetic protein PchC